MKPGKQARPLPGRGGLMDLAGKAAKAGANINDYSKASPLKLPSMQPASIIGLGKTRAKR